MLADGPPGITKKTILTRGTIIAVIITAPSLAAFFIGWLVLDDLIQAAIIGAGVHFVAMAFAFKIIKKYFVKGPKTR